MTNPMRPSRETPGLPTPPKGWPIGSYTTYAEAQRAVDYLSDQHFTVDKLAIVGRDIELVEQIVGRLNYGWAALRGAVIGMSRT